MDSSKGAINVLYNPTPSQQFSAEVSNTYNGKLVDEFGEDAKVATGRIISDGTAGGQKIEMETLEKANHPLSYTLGWNGEFFDGKLQTRWSYTFRTQAKHKYNRFLRMGQKLNLKKLQWYVDYNLSYDDLDRMKIASGEVVDGILSTVLPCDATSSQDVFTFQDAAASAKNVYVGKVRYQGLVTKMNWQFANNWNLMLKGMYETANLTKSEHFENYRKAFGYIGSIEYYPARKQQQDFRLFLAYTGRKYDYSKRCGLKDYNTDRIELGMIYRIKAY